MEIVCILYKMLFWMACLDIPPSAKGDSSGGGPSLLMQCLQEDKFAAVKLCLLPVFVT